MSKNTIVIESGHDIRKIATIHKYLTKAGMTIPTRAGLIKAVIDLYFDVISKNTIPFGETVDAMQYIEKTIGVRRSGKVPIALIEELRIEDIVPVNLDEYSKDDLLRMAKEAKEMLDKKEEDN